MEQVFLTSYGQVIGAQQKDNNNYIISEDYKEVLNGMPLRGIDRISQIFLASVLQTLNKRNLIVDKLEGNDYGFFLGTEYGALSSIYKFDLSSVEHGALSVNPSHFPNTVLNSPACQVEIKIGIAGPVYTISNGKTSAIDALGMAFLFVKNKKCTLAIAGGGDEISELGERIESTQEKESIGEAGAFVLLERESEHAMAEIIGYKSCDCIFNLNQFVPKIKELMAEIIEDMNAVSLKIILSLPYMRNNYSETINEIKDQIEGLISVQISDINWMGASGIVQLIEEIKNDENKMQEEVITCVICTDCKKISILALKMEGK